MRILAVALRQRRRDWPASLAFIAVIGSAAAVAGACLAIAYPVLSGTLPFRDPERLMALESLQKGRRGGVSWMSLEDLRGDSTLSIAGYSARTWGLQTEFEGHVEVVLSEQVTSEFFDALGVKPYLGEALTRRHEQIGNQARVWFSYDAWQKLLGGNRAVLERTVWINAAPYRLAGVLPPGFRFPHQGQTPDIYIPLNRSDYWGARGSGGLDAVVRLKPGISPSRFQSELDARSNILAAQFPATNRDTRFVASGLASFLVGDRLQLLHWILAAVGLLLIIATTNAGGIWLAQWLKQQRHASIKLALGASMRNVVAEQTAQALVLGVFSAAAGVWGAEWLLSLLRASAFLAPELRRFELWQQAALDPLLVVCLVLIAIAASLFSAALPLLSVSRQSLSSAVAANTRSATSRSSRRVRLGLAILQLTLTGSLAYAGMLVWRNVQGLLRADRGYRTEQVLISGIGIPEARYDTDEKMIRFHQRAIDELGRIPGVMQVAGGVSLPAGNTRTRFLLDGENAPRLEQRTASIGVASPGLLELLGVPLRRGRRFEASDRSNTPRVALVNQSFVNRYFPEGVDPLGHRLRVAFYNGLAMKPYAEQVIVGVIGDTLNRPLALETEPQIVMDSDQVPLEGFFYFLRSALPAERLRNDVARAVWRVDPEIERVGVRPLDTQVESALVNHRVIGWLFGVFGAISLLVVGCGLASSLAATFLEMTRELGIRAALGASPLRLAREAVRWGITAVAASWVLSLPISLALSRMLALNRSAGHWDLSSWVMEGAVLGLIAAAAGLLPARRASSIDPASTLRSE